MRHLKLRKVPPLPFIGNKSFGRKKFLEFLYQIPDGDDMIFIDLFGGSFYISYMIHKVFPNAKIICNDFDNYMERIQNIDKTNIFIDKVKEILKDAEKGKRVSDEVKAKIDELINNETDYIDFITLSASLLYSSQYTTDKEEFQKRVYWNHPVKFHYNEDISDYIAGIEFVKKDWGELFEEYIETENAIFIADPPYPKTNNFAYENKKWELADTLQTLEILKMPYFAYYTSSKTGLIDIIEYMKEQGIPISNYETFVYKRAQISNVTKENQEVILYNFGFADEEEEEEEFEEEECAGEEETVAEEVETEEKNNNEN